MHARLVFVCECPIGEVMLMTRLPRSSGSCSGVVGPVSLRRGRLHLGGESPARSRTLGGARVGEPAPRRRLSQVGASTPERGCGRERAGHWLMGRQNITLRSGRPERSARRLLMLGFEVAQFASSARLRSQSDRCTHAKDRQ